MSRYRRQIRALMKYDLVPLMAEHFGAINMDADQIAFYQSIEGREVVLVFTGEDAFDKQDDNYWLPNNTWDELP